MAKTTTYAYDANNQLTLRDASLAACFGGDINDDFAFDGLGRALSQRG